MDARSVVCISLFSGDVMDEDLQADWRGVLLGLRIIAEESENGRHLTLRHPAYLDKDADIPELLRTYIMNKLKVILAHAVVEQEHDNG